MFNGILYFSSVSVAYKEIHCIKELIKRVVSKTPGELWVHLQVIVKNKWSKIQQVLHVDVSIYFFFHFFSE